MVSGLVLQRDKGGAGTTAGTRATEADQASGGDPPHPAEPSEWQVHDVLYFVAR